MCVRVCVACALVRVRVRSVPTCVCVFFGRFVRTGGRGGGSHFGPMPGGSASTSHPVPDRARLPTPRRHHPDRSATSRRLHRHRGQAGTPRIGHVLARQRDSMALPPTDIPIYPARRVEVGGWWGVGCCAVRSGCVCSVRHVFELSFGSVGRFGMTGGGTGHSHSDSLPARGRAAVPADTAHKPT